MPLYKIKIEGEGNERRFDLQPIQPSTYSAEQLKERQDLQALLLNRPDAIDKDLLILREEFDSWQDSRRRIDLLALDKEANLVVIELKIEEEGGHMELQAIRYAAMVSAMDFEGVVRSREHLLKRQGKEPAIARQEVLKHLGLVEGEEATISNRPRIILISPSFSKEITTTVLWLINEGKFDIRCLEAKPYRLDGNLYLDIEQVLPLPQIADYIVRIAEKASEEARQSEGRRREPTVKLLWRHKILQEGTRVYLLHEPQDGLNITDERAKKATFRGLAKYPFQWDYPGNESFYSAESLCKELCDTFGGNWDAPHKDPVSCWAIEGEDVSLKDRALQLSFGNDTSADESTLS